MYQYINKTKTKRLEYIGTLVLLLIISVLMVNGEEIKNEEEEMSLYNSTDNVFVLNAQNFKNEVLNKNYSILVEFYNSFCSYCRNFAPIYKMLAAELYDWRDVLLISAIDCASDENYNICREYQIKTYPNLRYFSPSFQPTSTNINGKRIHSQTKSVITKSLIQFLAAENKTSNMINWPDLQPVQTAKVPLLFEGLDSLKKCVILVYEPENSTIGVETILNFLRYPNIAIRRITDLMLAAKYQIDGLKYKIAVIDRLGSIVPHAPLYTLSSSYKETITSLLNTNQLIKNPETKPEVTTIKHIQDTSKDTNKKRLLKIIEEVKRNRHIVYQADLEMAIRKILHNEIPKNFHINGQMLVALQRFLAVLKRYNPLGSAGRSLISELAVFVSHHSNELSGEDFEIELKKFEKQLGPIYSATHYVGCTGSQHNFRGFTCSLWQLFHFMTVQAANTDKSQDPLEVLQAIHGYIKYFFGCTDCSNHFQEMATNLKIWNTPSKEEAILWLWTAHNKVNQRLAGDATEDPQFPKIQFPSANSCSQCYKQNEIHSAVNFKDKWNKIQVLQFLKNIHNPKNVSRYGLENDKLLQPTFALLRQKLVISKAFSDVDMIVSILLYCFCIVVLVVVFKLLVFKRGYRKKSYSFNVSSKI